MPNSLFSFDQDVKTNACIIHGYSSTQYYMNGYKKAADILVEKIKKTGKNQDVLVYPIAFLYGQYIELFLKNAIKESRRLLNEPGTFPKHHKKITLWATAKSLLKKISEKVNVNEKDFITKKDFITVEKILNDYTEIDPYSDSFRYPENKNGNQSIAHDHINLTKLSAQMQNLAIIFDKFLLEIGIYQDIQSDMNID